MTRATARKLSIVLACILGLTGVVIFLMSVVPRAAESSSGEAHARFEETDTSAEETLAVTIHPGERLEDLIERLSAGGLTTWEAFYSVLAQFSARLPVELPDVQGISRYEGLLVPGTYRYSREDLPPAGSSAHYDRAARNARILLRPMIESARRRLVTLKPGYLNTYQQLVLASIVEKETVASGKYGEVSAVFHRRLKSGVPFGSCPSVEYALGYHRPFLTSDDVSIDSPYNLYKHRGLPPTPICTFSDHALRAVSDPPDTDFFFFVYDWTKDMLMFSRTPEEHRRNARQARSNYQQQHGRDSLRKVYRDRYYEE